MAYIDVAQMASTSSIHGRVTACAAQEGQDNPSAWSAQHIWEVVSAPGWDSAWASALTGGMSPEEAGFNAGVITDGMVLASVQAVRSQP